MFWAGYLREWQVTPAECGYTPTYTGNGTTTNIFASVTVNGLCAGTAYIYGSAQPYAYNPTKNLHAPCSCAGDPINLGTGEEYRDETDGDLGALNFHRYYNSHAAVASSHIGAHWRHSFDRSLEYLSDGTTSIATVFRANGLQVVFTLQNSQWTTDPDVSDRLTTQTNTSGGITGFLYFDSSTRYLEAYDANGNLLSITDTNGQVTTLAYSTASTPASVAPSAGLLLTVTDPRGRSLNFTYNAQGNVATATQPDGGVLGYAYDTNGNLVTVTYPDTKTRQYVYNESTLTGGTNLPNALTGDIDESGTRLTSIGYNAQGQATMSTLPGGVDLTQVVYNSNSTTSVTYPTGAQATLSFVVPNGSVHTSAVSAPCGPACGQPNAAATFDSNGYVASTTDFNGNVTTMVHDANGLLDQQVDGSGSTNQRTTNTTWNTALRVPLQTTLSNASGTAIASTGWVYNATGQPLARCEIDPAQASGYTCAATGTPPAGVRRWTYTYCTAVGGNCPLVGLLLSVTGPRTDLTQATSYSYYTSNSATGCGTPGAACHQAGDLYQVTDALGHTSTIASYDAAGRITRTTDANGVNTDLTYTPRGWLASRTVDGATTSFTYTPYGSVASVTDPDNVTTRYTYDSAHRLTKVTDALGNYIQYTLDAAGHVTGQQIVDSSGLVHTSLSRSYNALGQLTAVVDGLNHTVFNASASGSYDGNGNLVQSADALGTKRQQGYDALNRLVQTLDNYQGSDSTANTTSSFGYDAQDHLTGVTDPSQLTTTYAFDGLGNRTALSSPDTGGRALSYDAAGNVIRRTDARGVVTQYSYDALNRLTQVSYPAHPALNVTYTYDQATPIVNGPVCANIGHRTTMTDASGSTAWCYTNRGRIREVRQYIHSTAYTYGFTYSPGDRVTWQQYPSGFQLNYHLDGDGRISAISYRQQLGPYGSYTNTTLAPLITSVSYLPFGPVSGYTWASNNQQLTRSYDANYALTDLTGSALNLHFQRNALGQIVAEGNSAGANPASETYQYDPLARLTEVDGSAGMEQHYTYNASGDRTGKTVAGQATQMYGYVGGTHQLTTVGSTARTVDAAGNTTALTAPNGSLVGLGYDDSNRLTTVTRSGQTIASYQYNGMGDRVWRSVTPAAVATVYDPNHSGQLFGEYPQGTDYREYVYLDGIPVASATDAGQQAPQINYLYADALNTVRMVTNEQGVAYAQWPWLNNAFGEQAVSGSGIDNLRFPGQYYDAETGLSNNGYRTYDPNSGRYLQSDPIGLAGGISTYAYVGGNPLSEVDPSGLSTVTYDGNTHTVTYTRNDGTVAGTFPANNNTTRSSNGSWPNGTFNRVGSNPHPESDANGPYGSHGIITFDVPGRTGMGLHSGRADSGAQNHPTLGCVRTTDDSMETVRNLERTDPVTSINVVNNDPNAARQGTQQ